ncbi:MAG: hypothetical protein ACE5JB_04240, partial [bacterium]
MLKSIYSLFWLLFLILIYIGCAGSASGEKARQQKNYRATIGITYEPEFYGVLQTILVSKYQYLISRTEQSSREIYFETSWKDRPPFEDESETGIIGAQTRFIIRAKARHAGQYNIHLYAETQVLYESSEKWEPGPLSKML